MSNTERLYQIALTKLPLVGAVTAKTLIAYCGGTEAVFHASKKSLQKIPGIGEKTVHEIVNQQVLGEAERELQFLEDNEVQTFFYLDQTYPQRLRKYNDCPILLYYKGSIDLNPTRTVAIVGTRKCTHQGIAICEELVEGLRPYHPVIISGLAYGIDICAHKAALEADLPTIGVLGHGLKRIYPPAHRATANRMIEQGGLLTEFHSSSRPDREHFPMRNRIVAGLCDALIVIETAKRGGSMITAMRAAEYGRALFAVPGRIKDKMSEGCNYLIKENKAILLENADEIGYHLHWKPNETTPAARQAALFRELTTDEKTVIDFLSEREETHIDELLRDSLISNTNLSALLLNLEFEGLVKSLPGKRYMLV